MSDRHLVFLGDGSWRAAAVRDGDVHLIEVPLEPDATTEARVEAARRALADLGYADEPIALALPSSWCLCATIATDDLERGGRRRAMGFRLEEHLPCSAEEVVADYVPGTGGRALGVCALLAPVEPIVNAFEAAGVRVRHICPSAFLAAVHVVRCHAEGAGAVLVAEANGGEGDSPPAYDLVELRGGKPTDWWWFADDEAVVRKRLTAWTASEDRPGPVVALGDGGATDLADLVPEPLERVELRDLDRHRAAALHEAKLLEGDDSPWIDLRCDALAAPDPYRTYRRPLGALAAAVVFLLVCISGAAQWRGRRHLALREAYVSEQVDVFKEALPTQPVPRAGIKGRLLSEKRKLAGIGGREPGGAVPEATDAPSALAHLRRVLGSLPTDVRYRVLDLDIKPDYIRVDGQARDHAEAEGVAIAVRQSGHYEVQPPKTETLRKGGVSFLFTARPRRAPAAGPGGGTP